MFAPENDATSEPEGSEDQFYLYPELSKSVPVEPDRKNSNRETAPGVLALLQPLILALATASGVHPSKNRRA